MWHQNGVLKREDCPVGHSQGVNRKLRRKAMHESDPRVMRLIVLAGVMG